MITEESDVTLWTSLHNQWLAEGKPAYVVAGETHYTVFQLITGETAFKARTDKDMYETSSFEGIDRS